MCCVVCAGAKSEDTYEPPTDKHDLLHYARANIGPSDDSGARSVAHLAIFVAFVTAFLRH
jgi:hypothetical protein